MDKKTTLRTRFSLGYVVVALFAILLFQEYVLGPLSGKPEEVPYSAFREALDAGRVTNAVLHVDRVEYEAKPAPPEGDGGEVGERAPPSDGRETATEGEETSSYVAIRVEDKELTDTLVAKGVSFKGEKPPSGFWTSMFSWILPLIPLAILWIFLMKRLNKGGRGGMMSIGKSKAKEITGEMTGVTFTDVGGADQVEAELKEIIDFLKDPSRFTSIGAKLPTGVLLVGPPGTGKTLLAKATAGEAGVPFFSMSGSEFVEMFVGVGASRVRDLFNQAKERAPCIIFIDEIDAIGQSRSSAGAVRTNDEREQTLNQLLYEMDGFEPNQGVVIMAATNRPDVLDPALLRAGRFDRRIEVPLPSQKGRRQILGIHTRTVKLSDDVDLDELSGFTAGFSGADLANLVNEAALMAVRRGDTRVTRPDFNLAFERIVAGLERDMPLTGDTRKKVAYHEGGHALVSQLQPTTDQVHRVSIIPTSKGALGYTMEMPKEDQYLMGEKALRERLSVMLGGRAAESLIFGEVSTGASNDLERATDLARRMVTEFGMSEALGPVRYAGPAGAGYLQGQAATRNLSPETEALIDREVRKLIDEADATATELLTQHEAALHGIANKLQEAEVIEGVEVERIVQTTEKLP